MNANSSSQLECKPTEHRFFAVELIGIETVHKVILPIVCTQCGKLVKHVIEVN